MLLAGSVLSASAQSLGTFRWQLQPYCNVITVTVTQLGNVYTLDGYDDQCGAPQRAALSGTAVLNPDGSIGFGLHVVPSPAVASIGIEARISLASLSGTWQDSSGNAGTLAFNQSTGGAPRPAPTGSQVFSTAGHDSLTVASTTRTIPVPHDTFARGLWSVYLVRPLGNVYPIPGQGLDNATGYRVFSQASGTQTQVFIGRTTGPGEAYAEIRIIRAR